MMKLTIIFFLGSLLSAHASGYSQTVSLNENNVFIGEIFKEIKAQTGFTFAYGESVLKKAKRVSIRVSNITLDQALALCFRSQPFTYKIIDRTIVITPAEQSEIFTVVQSPPANDQLLLNISGKVVSDEGQPLAGATITLNPGKKIVTTNELGIFSIAGLQEGEYKLEASFVGYEPVVKKLSLKNSNVTNLSFVMYRAVSGLSDVVVVGYGTQRKSDVTGSIATVKFSDIKSPALSSLQQGLQGRSSGVQVLQTGGALDGRFAVVIRGTGSINSGTEPLYVVDGIPLFSSALSTINSDDIESINILKDASATAIYGSRAANGVVLIKTKNGKPNSSKIVVNAEYGFEKVSRLLEMLTSEEQRQLTYDAFVNSGLPTDGYDDPNDPLWQEDNNWQKLMTRTGRRSKYTLSSYGGTDKTQYGLSGSYTGREGIIKNTDIQLWNFRMNLDHKFSKRFSLSARLSGTHQRQRLNDSEGFFGGVIRDAFSTHSHTPLYDDQGNFTAAPTAGAPYWGANSNPLAALLENEKTLRDTRLLGGIKAEYLLTKELSLSASLGADILNRNRRTYLPKFTRGITQRAVGDLTISNSSEINWIGDITLQYQKIFNGLHDLTALVGGSAQQYNAQGLVANGTGTTNNLLNQLGNQTSFTSSSWDITSGLTSSFLRVIYGFNSRYLFTGTVRADGSSKFPKENRYGTFPSGSIAWRISKESFFKSRVITDLKWRTSYGLTGNQNISDFAYMTKASSANYISGNDVVLGNAAFNQGNPNLKWESSKQFDVGIDMEILSGRLFFTADYYDKRSDDLLIQIPLPRTAGVSQASTVNLGSIQNKGFEFAINSRNLVGKWKWSTDFNLTFNRNKVLDIGRNAIGEPFQIPGVANSFSGITNLTEAGRPIGAFYFYIWDGIWQLNEADKANAFSGAKPGDPKYRDINGDGLFSDADRTFIDAQPNPKFFGGLTNNVEYKNWSLNFILNGAWGHKVINTAKFLYAGSFPFLQNLKEVKNRWTPDNPTNDVPQANQVGNSTTLVTRVSTRHLQDASFIRLKSISLSYDLPKQVLQYAKLQSMRLMLAANNLLTITKYEGFDPEASSLGNQLSAGIDQSPYPLSRIYTATLQIVF